MLSRTVISSSIDDTGDGFLAMGDMCIDFGFDDAPNLVTRTTLTSLTRREQSKSYCIPKVVRSRNVGQTITMTDPS